MSRKGVLTVAIGLALLAFGSFTFAQHDHGGGGMGSMPMPSATTGKITGQVADVSPKDLTVKVVHQNHSMDETFMISAKTKVKGDLQKGANVTVKYSEQNGVKTATEVEVQKAKPSGKS